MWSGVYLPHWWPPNGERRCVGRQTQMRRPQPQPKARGQKPPFGAALSCPSWATEYRYPGVPHEAAGAPTLPVGGGSSPGGAGAACARQSHPPHRRPHGGLAHGRAPVGLEQLQHVRNHPDAAIFLVVTARDVSRHLHHHRRGSDLTADRLQHLQPRDMDAVADAQEARAPHLRPLGYFHRSAVAQLGQPDGADSLVPFLPGTARRAALS